MTSEFRCDRSVVKHWERTPEGFLRFTAPVAREGVLLYKNKDGTERTEHVSAEVLKRSADSLKIKPVTTPGHPPVLLTKQNAKDYTAGSTGNTVWFDSGFLWVTGTVFDAETIGAIESGDARELSLGYQVQTRERSDGSFEQINRIVNHLSPVTKARAEGAGFVLDAADDEDSEIWVAVDSIESTELSQPNTQASTSTGRIKRMTYKASLDGIEFELDSVDLAKHIKTIDKELNSLRSDSSKTADKLAAATDSIATLKAELKEVTSEKSEIKTSLDSAQSELGKLKPEHEALKAEAEKLKSDRADGKDGENAVPSDESIAEYAAERMKLWSEVLPFMRSDSPNFEPDFTLNPLAIMAEAVKVANPDLADHIDGLNLDEAENAGFIKGLYATLNSKQFAQSRTKTRSNVDALLNDIRAGRANADMAGMMSAEAKIEKARKARLDRIAGNSKKGGCD